MIDIAGNPIKEGSLIAYGVTSTESLKMGIVTGISPVSPDAKYANNAYNCSEGYKRTHSLLQITPLDQSKLNNKWHIYFKRCVVLEPENVDIVQMERYYYLQSLLEDWNNCGKNIHDRDKSK